uniref:Ig-like domain-containing protein n=1 Tax=Scophthalmus maximus TaxID=52904 RepID=A0A8D3AKW0_SCOMX
MIESSRIRGRQINKTDIKNLSDQIKKVQTCRQPSRQHQKVTVTCSVSEDCVLPCSFPPAGEETVEWFRQDEHLDHQQLGGRASVFPHLISRGNATLILRRSGLKDRGTYRCHVRTASGEHNAKVILKVEGEAKAPKTHRPYL